MERDLFNLHIPNVYDQIMEEVKKSIAVYFRVSGSSQSIKLQKDKAKNWAKENGYSWNEDIEVFNENVLSANQVAMENRPELMRLLKAIETGQIKVLIVFARDRLARNYWEYMEMVSLILRYKVKVIIVGETAPFSYNFLTEGIHGIQIQQDGTNIATRIQTVQKLYPEQKFGYINDKKNKRYLINEKSHYLILTLFQEVLNTDSFEELIKLLNDFKNETKRKSIEDCWKLLRTSFYAGYYSKNGTYFRLQYIDQIISLEVFKRVQEVLDHFETDFIKALRMREQEALYHPSCSLCGKKMTHSKGKIGASTAFYYCKGHKSNKISVQELDTEIYELITKIVKNLSREKLNKLGIYSANKVIRSLKGKKEQLNGMMKNERNNFFSRKRIRPRNPKELLNQYHDCIKEQEFIQRQINDLKDTKTVLNNIEKMIKQKLFYKINTDEIYIYLSFLLEDIQVNKKSIDFKVYFTEFLEGELNA